MAPKSSKQIRREEKARRKQAQELNLPSAADAPVPLLLGLAFVLAVLTSRAYANSFKGDFVYDDTKWIEQMSVDRVKDPIRSALGARRPVVDLTLTYNYIRAEKHPAPRAMTVRELPDPYGYHVVNLIIHILAGLTLFGLVRRTIRIGPFSDPVKESAHWIAFCIAMLWLLHPLQTQSVTYIIQRAESMMGLFYLLTLYCLLRYATTQDGPIRISWLICTLIAACLGMGSKAVMVTVPIVALIFDRAFLAQNWRELFSKRWPAHACIAASLLVLVSCGVVKGVLFKPNARNATVGFGLSNKQHQYYVSPFEYLLTEAKVIPRYLKLSALPTDQVLDYKMEKVDPHVLTFGELFSESLLPGAFVLLMLGATAFGLYRRHWLGFVGVWFFVILAPTSSIIPIRDPIYEHRMYLSLAAVIALFVAGLWFVLQRLTKESLRAALGPICAAVCLIPAAAFAYGTYQRNALYQDPTELWEDNIAKVPDNWRARNNLAKRYLDIADEKPKNIDKAINHLVLAVQNNPQFVNGWYNLGNAYSRKKEYDKAIDAYQNALKSNPRYTVAHIMIGNAYTDKGNMLFSQRNRSDGIAALEQAAEAFKTAIPTAERSTTNERTLRARAQYNLGNTYSRLWQLQNGPPERLDLARAAYADALETLPNHSSARVGIGLTYIRQSDFQKAIHWFDEALKYNPPPNETMIALFNRGNAYLELGQYPQAAESLRQCTAKFPNLQDGWLKLAESLEKQGRPQEALAALKNGVAVIKNSVVLFREIASIAKRLGQSADEAWATGEIQRLVKQKP
ncbi:MAG: tetratricopeptide repeat protein [Phycisphaerales bacterium]|nr:tetratricopeptide repeat protein [Phycisphaerales bacterium]MCB9857942.1 tetratricopeptide repeat protein [Phycisphaerales bacterium]